jgi:DNA recombination protein RmuC
MNPILLIIGGVVVGGVGYLLGMLITKSKMQAQAGELLTANQLLESLKIERDTLLSEKAIWQENQLAWAKTEQQLNADLRHAQATIERLSTQATSLETDLKELNASNNRTLEDRARLESQLNALKDQLDENQTQWKTLWEEKLQNYLTKELDGTREHLKTLAKQEDEQRHEKFEDLVKPVKEMLDSYQDKLTQMDVGYQKQIAVVSDQVTGLMKAKNDLVSVLKHNTGDWGELQLLRILELAGLKKDTHYVYQEMNESGQYPDVKVFLPEKGYVIVDSKSMQFSNKIIDTSLSDQPSSTLTVAEENEAHAKAFVKSIKASVDSLNKANYTKGKTSETPDFVVMFLPQESMLSNAMDVDPVLWEYAWSKKVALASPLTLIAMLRLIEAGWQHETFSREMQEVMSIGEKVHSRLIIMMDRIVKVDQDYTKLGTSLQALRTSYDGNLGLVKSAKQLEDLGVKSNKSVPSALENAPYILETLPVEDA